jgi:GTP-binding protein YchF
MAVECGIVGLPNVGKSTLFNTLTMSSVPAENFPFCTVDPNKGVVEVPDPRLKTLAELVKPERVVPTILSFVDIAGLVKGASKGEGLGNQFLSHIRKVDAICHVVRCFEDPNVTHVMGSVDPVRDIEIIDMELCLSDLETVKRRIEKLEKLAKSGNQEAKEELAQLKNMENFLNDGSPLRRYPDFVNFKGDVEFLTAKPVMYVANIAEGDLKSMSGATKDWIESVEAVAKRDSANLIVLSVSLEFQLSQLKGEDLDLFLNEFSIQEPGLHRVIRRAYELLGLITFFTAGEKEVRAWTVKKGASAVEAAGSIHSDFARGFIRAETIHFDDFVQLGGEKAAREKGLQRAEGRDYRVQDADIMHFRFNV